MKIVSEARRIDVDPALDGFGHHNPELTQGDDLWSDAMAVDWMIEGLFRGRDLSANEMQFMRLIRMEILDGSEGYDLPMTASTLAMRHTASVTMRLWAMYENEQQRVSRQALGSGLGFLF